MLAENLAFIHAQLETSRHSSPLAAATVTLVAACKSQSRSAIDTAIALGVDHFGENRVQEALAKWPEIKKQHPQVRLHLIGPLQTNKVAEAVALFDVIETVDREKLVDALHNEMHRQQRFPRCLIQVNTGEEPQKAGIPPAGVAALLEHCRARGLILDGLMCVPPADAHPAPHFALLRKLADENGLAQLSMGMSGDYAVAVRLGATHVRLGTALFGART